MIKPDIKPLIGLKLNKFYPFSEEDINKIEYYLTPINSNGLVKLAQKFKLKNLETYGNIIAIPFVELQRLVAEAKNGI